MITPKSNSIYQPIEYTTEFFTNYFWNSSGPIVPQALLDRFFDSCLQSENTLMFRPPPKTWYKLGQQMRVHLYIIGDADKPYQDPAEIMPCGQTREEVQVAKTYALFVTVSDSMPAVFDIPAPFGGQFTVRSIATCSTALYYVVESGEHYGAGTNMMPPFIIASATPIKRQAKNRAIAVACSQTRTAVLTSNLILLTWDANGTDFGPRADLLSNHLAGLPRITNPACPLGRTLFQGQPSMFADARAMYKLLHTACVITEECACGEPICKMQECQVFLLDAYAKRMAWRDTKRWW